MLSRRAALSERSASGRRRTAAFTCGGLALRHTTGVEEQAQLLRVGQVGSHPILTWSGYMPSEPTATPSKSRAPAIRFTSRARRRLRTAFDDAAPRIGGNVTSIS
jgi:hypothetical protein